MVGVSPSKSLQAQAQLCFLPSRAPTQAGPLETQVHWDRLQGAGWSPPAWVWGSALCLPLSLSRGGLYFILFVGRLGLLSGFNDLCHYL